MLHKQAADGEGQRDGVETWGNAEVCMTPSQLKEVGGRLGRRQNGSFFLPGPCYPTGDGRGGGRGGACGRILPPVLLSKGMHQKSAHAPNPPLVRPPAHTRHGTGCSCIFCRTFCVRAPSRPDVEQLLVLRWARMAQSPISAMASISSAPPPSQSSFGDTLATCFALESCGQHVSIRERGCEDTELAPLQSAMCDPPNSGSAWMRFRQ